MGEVSAVELLNASNSPLTAMSRFALGLGNYTTAARPVLIDSANYPNFFESRFNNLIRDLGTFKIKKKETPLLMYYFKMKLKCKSSRYDYETIVVGDDCDKEADARESVFAKASEIILTKFKDQRSKLRALERQQQTEAPPNSSVSEIMMMQP